VVCSFLQPSSVRGLATPWTCFLHLSLSSVILVDSSTRSPVHVLVLSLQAVRGLPRLRTRYTVTSLTVPCIISFSRHFACNFCGEAYVPENIPTSLQQQRVYSKRQSVKVCSMCPSVATHCRQRVHLPML